jgi:hypothetical protein
MDDLEYDLNMQEEEVIWGWLEDEEEEYSKNWNKFSLF